MSPPLTVRLRQRAVRAATSLPPAVLRALAGPAEVVDGQELDVQLQAGLKVQRRFGPRLDTMTPAEARRAAIAAFEPYQPSFAPMARVFDELAPGPAGPIPVRVYLPSDHDGGLLVWLHGGGGVIGSIASADPFCRDLARGARCAVASVEYRLAPEHPHPAAIDDALAAWPWLVAHARRWGADPARVAVGGDSFGGYLAAWVERRGRAARPPLPAPRAQLLFYPLLDLTLTARSCELFADGYGLTRALTHWFRGHYLPDLAACRDASPGLVADVAGAPPTLIVAAGFDPIRDDGRAYAERLAAAGGTIRYQAHPSLIHGFIDLVGACAAARRAVDDAAAWLNQALA